MKKISVKNMDLSKKIPPDGGYGWVIALALAISNFIYIPFMHSFGLIFRDTFEELGLSATEISLIITLHASFGMLMGLLNGVLLKMFGFRKVAFIAAILYFSGLVLTSFATTFVHFLICYSLIASLGAGFIRSSYNLATNTYFKKRRSKAMSVALTITSLGFIVMPQLVTLLLEFYTPQGVVLIMAGISAHIFATALLLHPVKWHMIDDPDAVNEETVPSLEDTDEELDNIKNSVLTNISDEKLDNKKKSIFTNISNIFDFDLLKDLVFINILVGMAFLVFAELNFNILIPFIMKDYNLTTEETATFMSVTAIADIIFRSLAPYIGDLLKKSPRYIFILTVFVTVIMRFAMLLTSTLVMLLVVAVGLGVSKGVRRIYTGLIVPAHVSLEKLPSASGMEMMANGLCILSGGSLLGMLKDLTGSYSWCILFMNFVCVITIIMWSTELVCLKKWKNKPVSNTTKEFEENTPLSIIA